MYDIFYVSKDAGNDADWNEIKSQYPLAQRLQHVKSYRDISSRAFTKMFWVIWDDLKLNKSFDPLEYRATKWDDMYVHVFKNGQMFDGVCLFPKLLNVSDREFEYRYFISKKEIDIELSRPKRYNIYRPNTYEEYESITDDIYWLVWPEIEIIDESIFDYTGYDRKENHIFKNLCNDQISYVGGILLNSKHKKLSKREFENKYAVDKKEHDKIASRYRYPRYHIKSYKEYQEILEKENQKMFWCQWPNTEVLDETVFDLYFDPSDGQYDYDRNENHVFKNLCNGSEYYLSGLTLFSKSKIISKKEFDRQYLMDKKEHDKIATCYRYNRYVINTYEDYEKIIKTETQPLFWGIWPEIEVTDNSVFDLYFDPNNGKYDHDRNENHVFKNLFNDKEIFINGVTLFSKEKMISHREFIHRFLIEKKEHNRTVSKHKLYDVVFISYNESNADSNYKKLLDKCPRAKRIHGVKGIHQAHIKAAELCNTDMFWVVDGDAIIEDDFDFNLVMSSYDIDCVHVWKSRNPVNNLEYGNGGIKLLPRQMVVDMNVDTSDMTTSISKKFKAVDKVSNINSFNTDEFSTWRSAFRECCKLASRVIERQDEEETTLRLQTWCSKGEDKPFGKYAMLGAKSGKLYGELNKNNPTALAMINNFDWLKEQFDARQD